MLFRIALGHTCMQFYILLLIITVLFYNIYHV